MKKHLFVIFIFLYYCDGHAHDLFFQDLNYFIKKEYVSRNTYHHHDDRNFGGGPQREIYELALEVAEA